MNRSVHNFRSVLLGVTGTLLLASCQSITPLETVDQVELERFMGDWYVIASIPTSLEKGAHNAIESYRLDDDGTIATTFTFRKDSFDGTEKEYHPRGFIRDTQSNAEWGMQFIWPIKADYRIVWLNETYSTTVIGRNKRDYVWLMARTPTIDEQLYQELVQFITESGYDSNALLKVPQQW